jgi:hypothetical protein
LATPVVGEEWNRPTDAHKENTAEATNLDISWHLERVGVLVEVFFCKKRKRECGR